MRAGLEKAPEDAALSAEFVCDSSVIGGCFDAEFKEDSRRFIEAVKNNQITLLLSQVVIRQILDAPENVQELLASVPTTAVERIPLSTEVIKLLARPSSSIDETIGATTAQPLKEDNALKLVTFAFSSVSAPVDRA